MDACDTGFRYSFVHEVFLLFTQAFIHSVIHSLHYLGMSSLGYLSVCVKFLHFFILSHS
jgi:hypothetical protein